MAIQSALAVASSAVSSAASSQKPCFKLSGDLNGNSDYDVRPLNRMSRQSAKLHSSSRSKTEASLRYNSGDLKAVHLDRIKSLVFQVEKMKENAASSKKNSTEKHRMKKEKKSHNDTRIKYNNGHHSCKQRQHAHKSSAQDDMKPLHRFDKYA
jgi:regulator of replication initiation timing